MKVYICSEILGGEIVYININILLSYMVKMITWSHKTQNQSHIYHVF